MRAPPASARTARRAPPAEARPARAAATADAPRPRPSPPGRRSRPCRRRGGRPAPGSRTRAPAPSSRGPRGRSRASTPASSSSTRPTRPAACSPGRITGSPSGRRFQVASTRIGSPPSPASAARSSRCDGSWAVDGATSTSGSAPGGASTDPKGGSHITGPTTCTPAGQLRGYSSWGNVATMHSRSLNPPWSRETGGSPSRTRASFRSVRPRRSPACDRAVERLPHQPAEPACAAAARRAHTAETQVPPTGIQVRDQRRHRNPLELARHRRRERQDVVHDDIGPHFRDRTPRNARGTHHRLVHLERLARHPGTAGTRARARTASRRPRRARASATRSRTSPRGRARPARAPSASIGKA